MNPIKISAKTADVGGIPVARTLPQAKKRSIGAWCFLDHAGPAQFADGQPGLQVGSHPHTHLQTFTWMLQGEILHKDSLGNERLIQAKQVNLMTAGRGICHTEQTPPSSRSLHAVQLWIALPKNRDIPASFHHYPQLPEWQDETADYILTTGSFQEHTAPTLQYTPLVGLDIRYRKNGEHTLPLRPDFEYGLLVLQGRLNINGEAFGPDELAYLPSGADRLTLSTDAGTHLMLLGGTPLDFEPLIWWNFVAPDRTEIEQARADWQAHSPRFGSVDTELKRLNAPKIPWVKKQANP